jgi:hypothetical protein
VFPPSPALPLTNPPKNTLPVPSILRAPAPRAPAARGGSPPHARSLVWLARLAGDVGGGGGCCCCSRVRLPILPSASPEESVGCTVRAGQFVAQGWRNRVVLFLLPLLVACGLASARCTCSTATDPWLKLFTSDAWRLMLYYWCFLIVAACYTWLDTHPSVGSPWSHMDGLLFLHQSSNFLLCSCSCAFLHSHVLLRSQKFPHNRCFFVHASGVIIRDFLAVHSLHLASSVSLPSIPHSRVIP